MWQRHPWPETIEEAIAIQEHLRPLVITENQLETVRYVAGVDVGYQRTGFKAPSFQDGFNSSVKIIESVDLYPQLLVNVIE
ncbi:hypothetical protein [Microcoleus sp.]|uniref:hypothetical protein n=1 Tax=Microcoleus sp. TaxID=44472 RepID=UPI0035942C45